MSRKSQRFLWKQGDGDGKKEDLHPKLYDEPPHELVDGDEATYPPKYVELSSMWVYQVVRCPFISQEVRYQRWPAVFPSKDPLRTSWINKGLTPKVWSDVRQVWVYPVVFGKYQLHGEEGASHFDIDQSAFIDSAGTHAAHDIREGAECIVQEPSSLSSNTAAINEAAPTDDAAPPGNNDNTPKINTGKKSKVPVFPKGSKEPKTATNQDIPKEATAETEAKRPKPAEPKEAKRPKAAGAKTGSRRKEQVTDTEPETPTKKTKPETPTKTPKLVLLDSASGGKRFALDEDSDKEATPDHIYNDLERAQGKVVLLASALHNTWSLLGRYSERMTEWSAVCRLWAKQSPDDKEEFQTYMANLSDNRELNNILLIKANTLYDEIARAFPAMERITRDDLDDWRDTMPEGLNKLFEAGDKAVDARGELMDE
jgi:hypothetical protein